MSMPPSMKPKLLAGVTTASQGASRIEPRWMVTSGRSPQYSSQASTSGSSTAVRIICTRQPPCSIEIAPSPVGGDAERAGAFGAAAVGAFDGAEPFVVEAFGAEERNSGVAKAVEAGGVRGAGGAGGVGD